MFSFKKIFKTDKRAILLKKITKAGFPSKEIFIGVKDFFEGNEDIGSIGVNIYPHPPSLNEFYQILSEIEKSADTENILIRIADVEDTEWFYTDTVYISGNYSLEQVKKLFKKLKPDEIYEGRMYNDPSNLPQIKTGSKSYSVWWD